MRTRPASIATVVIAIGLALTSAGIARGLPFSFGGVGSRSTIGADLWAHGTAISPALVALVCLGLLAAIAMRPTRGGRRSAAWLAVVAAALTAPDLVLTPLVYAFHVGLIALILSAIGETRRADGRTIAPLTITAPAVSPAEAPVSAVIPGVPGPAPVRARAGRFRAASAAA